MAMGQSATGERRPRQEITNPHLLEALEKVEMLEGTLNSFRAEMDMKMRILEQILATRNEQVTVQKKLLEREEILYSSLMGHWKDAPNLVASGHSLNFNNNLDVEDFSDHEDDDDNADDRVDHDDSDYIPGRTVVRGTRRSKRTRNAAFGDSGDMNDYSTISAENGDEESDSEVSSKRYRGRELDYHIVRTFPDKDTAVQEVKLERKWWKSTDFRTKEGLKMSYICRHDKKCSARIYLLVPDDKDEVTLYHTDRPHDHLSEVQAGIPRNIKERINELYSSGIRKPRVILRRLREESLPEPSNVQLSNYLKTIRPPQPRRDKEAKKTQETSGSQEGQEKDEEDESWEETADIYLSEGDVSTDNPGAGSSGMPVDVKLELDNQLQPESDNLNEPDEGGDRSSPKKRVRATGRSEYNKIASFPTVEEANAYVRSLKEWTQKAKNDTAEGFKVHYCCKDMNFKCPARVQVLSEPDKPDVCVYRNTVPHNHARKPKVGLPEETKEKIQGYFAQGILSSAVILEKLKKDGVNIESKEATIQVTNWVAQYRRKHGLVGQRKRGRKPKRGNDTTDELESNSTDHEFAPPEHREPSFEMASTSYSYQFQHAHTASAFGGFPPLQMNEGHVHPGYPYNR